MGINMELAESKGLSKETIAKIIVRHKEREIIFEEMGKLNPLLGVDRHTLKVLAESLTRIEYELQGLWGFVQDSRFHRFFDLPFCKCPVMDNEERLGTNSAIIVGGCPIHGFDS